MKIKISQRTVIRITCLIIFLLISPFAVEIVLLADIVGVEFAITFLFIYLGSYWTLIKQRGNRFKAACVESFDILSKIYVYRPKVYFTHVTVSSVFLILTGSVLLSTLVWVPAVLMSGSALGAFV